MTFDRDGAWTKHVVAAVAATRRQVGCFAAALGTVGALKRAHCLTAHVRLPAERPRVVRVGLGQGRRKGYFDLVADHLDLAS